MIKNNNQHRVCFMDCGQNNCPCKERIRDEEFKQILGKFFNEVFGGIEEPKTEFVESPLTPTGEAMEIFDEILNECNRQDEKWGVRDLHPASWFLILNEEIGEAAMEVNDAEQIAEDIDLENYRTELVQSAAVIVQMIKNIKYYR